MEIGLTTALRMAWAAATLPIIVTSLPFKPFGFFHQLLVGFAARGKTMPPSSKFTVPQRFFFHFYVVAVLLTTCLVLSTWFYAYKKMIPFSSESLQFATVPNHLIGGSHPFSIQKSTSAPVKHEFEGSLRKQRSADEYILPKGDWFEFVSCPHYLAEIVSNLVFAAAETHRWYHHKFDHYPPSRRAIIPWIF